MAHIYALLQADGSLLAARQKGNGWAIVSGLQGVEARGRNLTIFLNGLDVLGLAVSIPARNDNQARRAAPFAVEDDIAETVEQSHVALAPANKADLAAPRDVSIVSNAAMDSLKEKLASEDLSEAAVIAAHSVLPKRDVLLEGPGLILGRLGARTFTVDASIGKDVLLSLVDAHPDAEILGGHVALALGRTSSADGAPSNEALLVRLAEWQESSGAGINLLQGAYESRRPVDLQGITRWRFAAGLAAMATLGWFGNVMLETSAMNKHANGLRQLSSEFARAGWPETSGDVQQALALSGGLRGNDTTVFPSVLNATAILYDAIAEIEGAEIRNLRYDRLRQQMTASVAFQSFADVDRLTAVINGNGLLARAGDARQSGTKVVGDLTLEAAS